MGEKHFLILAIVLVSALTGCLEGGVKEKAPDFTLTDIDGNNVTLSNYLGKVVLINFFATWCLPCKEEMPELVAFHEKHGNEIIMISIDTDVTESIGDIISFMQEYNAEWIFALDTTEEYVMGKYKVIGVPSTFIVDPKGDISYMHLGPVKENELLREMDKAMG